MRTDPAFRIAKDEAHQALARFLRLPFTLVTVADLYAHAFTFARSYQLDSLYDSLYIVIAQLLVTELWTTDQRLLTALGGRALWVRFIGEYPLPGDPP